MPAQTQSRRQLARRSVAEVGGAATFIAYAVLLLYNRLPPSLTDYANWVYQGVLLHRHLIGLIDTAHRLKSYPVPNSAATLGVGFLCFLLPWKWAADVWLCVQLAASWTATRHLMRTIGASSWLWAIVPTVTYLNVNFWYGFLNFQLGLCWVALIASLLIRDIHDDQLGHVWSIATLLVICFFTHMIPFAFCVLLVILYVRQTRCWRMLWSLLPGGVLAVWYVAGRFMLENNADGQAGMIATVKTYSGDFWVYKVGSYLKSFGYVNPASANADVFGHAGLIGLLAVNIMLCGLLGWSMLQMAKAALREQWAESFVWSAILLILPIYLILPGAALGVSDPGARLLQTGLALAIVLCGQKGTKVLRVAAGSAALIGLAGIILFMREGFTSTIQVSHGTQLSYRWEQFNHIPNHDQDYFYDALKDGRMDVPIFPTGLFLNQKRPLHGNR